MKLNKTLLLIFVFVISSFNVFSVLTDNITSYYSFDESSGVVFTDSVSGLKASLVGTNTVVTGKLGNTRQLVRASSNNFELNDTGDIYDFGSGDFAFSFWVNRTSVDGSEISRDDSAVFSPYLIHTESPQDSWYESTSGSSWALGPLKVATMNTTEYTHYVIMRSSGRFYSYQNAVLVTNTTDTTNYPDKTANLNVGLSGVSGYFNGQIDEFGSWKGRGLTFIEIQQLYNNGTGYNPYTISNITTNNITFYALNPANITSTTLFSQNIILQYNITNKTGVNNTFVNITSVTNRSSCFSWLLSACVLSNGSSTVLYSSANTTQIYNYTLTENVLYPSSNFLTTEKFNVTHNVSNLNTANDLVDIMFKKTETSTTYNFFEVMANGTTSATVYFCNASYSTGNPSVNSNCVQIYQGVLSINHSHGPRVAHALIPFSINQTAPANIGGIPLGAFDSHFIIKGGNTNFYTVPNLTGEANVFRTSTNNGATWTDQSAVYTVDAHLHQFNSNGYFTYKGCLNRSGVLECTSTLNETIDLSILNPLPVSIISPINQTYTQYVNISYVILDHPNAPSINNNVVRIDLLNNDSTFNQTIRYNALNTSYLWNTYGFNLSISKDYYLNITINDTNNARASSISQAFNFSSNSLLNISAYNNSVLINFSINITDFNTGLKTVVNSTNGTVLFNSILGHYYILDLDPAGSDYAITNQNVTVNVTPYVVSFNLRPSNSVNLTIRDENTNALVTQNVTVTFSLTNSSTQYIYTTNTGNVQAVKLNAGTYSVLFESPSPTAYSNRVYLITVGNRSAQDLTVYLNTGGTVTFSYNDFVTGDSIDAVAVTMYRVINSTWTVVESRNTDITGRVVFTYNPITKYQFLSTKSGYQNKNFELDPILFTSYFIKMIPTDTTNTDYDDVAVYHTTSFNYNIPSNFSFKIQSPSGILTSYYYNLSWTCGALNFAGTNAIGDISLKNYTITCGGYLSRVNLFYSYTTSEDLTKNFSYYYTVSGAGVTSNYTFYSNKGKTYGLGDFERILIVTIIMLVIAGVGAMIGGLVVGLGLGLFIMGYFLVIGFIPAYVGAIALIVGFIYIMSRGGN